MTKLIIDAAKNKIFFMIINKSNVYNITHQNTKVNFERMVILINEFLHTYNIEINEITKIYVHRGPGSFAGIRNSLSIIKAIHLVKKVDYYCYSLSDFQDLDELKYEKIPDLCDKFNIKKNLINPIYLS